MKEMELYNVWCAQELEDPDLKDELASVAGNEAEIQDRFYKELEFGTGGLRGVLGAGTNRLNIYTIRKATQGLANFLKNKYPQASAAIAYDSRIKSDLFAREAARVLAANGVTVHLYTELSPTPTLSYAVRELGCEAGIVVTASHNPAKYNGYKVYGADGCQITLEVAEAVLNEISAVDTFRDVRTMPFDEAVAAGKIRYIEDKVMDGYLACVQAQAVNPGVCEKAGLKVVYTPLNGTGNKPVRRILKMIGIQDVTIVGEQELPDGNFPTCPFPNPEIKEALALGLALSEKTGADLLLATDPDCDRVGIAVKNGADYVLISGNEVGALLLDYLAKSRIEQGTMPKDPICVKTIVSTKIVDKIAADYGVQVIDVLTGFKFIGEQIGMLEQKGEAGRYLLGFEESYGYLAGSYVRDKDAVVGAMLICEMAAYYKEKGKTLYEVLQELYAKYGYYLHTQGNFVCEGASGMERMKQIMQDLRENTPKEIGGLKVLRFSDYVASESTDCVTGEKTAITLPKSDVLAFDLEENASVIIRPSGTEPKIKAYYTSTGVTREEAAAVDANLSKDFKRILGF